VLQFFYRFVVGLPRCARTPPERRGVSLDLPGASHSRLFFAPSVPLVVEKDGPVNMGAVLR